MKTANVNLHLRRKSLLLYGTAFLTVILLLAFVVSASVNVELSQIHTLLRSDYQYSATAQSSTANDVYFQFNAGITFVRYKDDQKCLNVDVLMQVDDSQYTDAVFWNTEKLGVNGIAVTANIAYANDLNVGDVLYSKHIVLGEFREYRIEAILPNVAIPSKSNDLSSNGLLVMGYDEQYVNNVSHACLIYANEPIEQLVQQCDGTPENIVYREDEVRATITSVIPYFLVYALVATAGTVCLVAFLSKEVRCNFKRLAMLGWDLRILNRAFYSITLGVGLLAVFANIVLHLVSFGCYGINATVLLPIACVAVIEGIALVGTSVVLNKHLWRR